MFSKLTMDFMVGVVSKLEDVAGLRILDVSGLDIPCGWDQDHGTGMRQRDQASEQPAGSHHYRCGPLLPNVNC